MYYPIILHYLSSIWDPLGTWGYFPSGKVAEAWSWRLPTI